MLIRRTDPPPKNCKADTEDGDYGFDDMVILVV